jgi:flagellar biosynthetic protein FliP
MNDVTITAPGRTAAGPVAAPPRRGRRALRFAGHYLEMVAAMAVGMVLLGPVWHSAWPGLADRPDLDVVVMATNMSIGMAAWMRLRGHGWGGIGWMCASMYAAFAVVLPLYWAGLVDAGTMSTAGHLLMLPFMLLVMLRRHRPRR